MGDPHGPVSIFRWTLAAQRIREHAVEDSEGTEHQEVEQGQENSGHHVPEAF